MIKSYKSNRSNKSYRKRCIIEDSSNHAETHLTYMTSLTRLTFFDLNLSNLIDTGNHPFNHFWIVLVFELVYAPGQ